MSRVLVMQVDPVAHPITSYRDIHGWFHTMDARLFHALLSDQAESPAGDLVEIGVFKGKSAVVIGDHLRPGERFVVIDIFGDVSLLDDDAAGRANASEQRRTYRNLSREEFERTYLALHPQLPVVVQAASGRIVDHVEPGAARFIHIDASHLYAGVAEDCRSAKRLLRPGGVVAFDDWRNHKFPGVAAAIWEAVVRDGLIPIAVTPSKLYGVYAGAEHALEVVRAELASDPEWWIHDEHEIFGHTVLRIGNMSALRRRRAEKRRRRARREARLSKRTRATSPTASAPRRSVRSYVSQELLPPALRRRLRRRRRG